MTMCWRCAAWERERKAQDARAPGRLRRSVLTSLTGRRHSCTQQSVLRHLGSDLNGDVWEGSSGSVIHAAWGPQKSMPCAGTATRTPIGERDEVRDGLEAKGSRLLTQSFPGRNRASSA